MRCGLLLVALLIALTGSAAVAQAPTIFRGPGFGGASGTIVPPPACGAGQLDFSDSTGCNTIWAGH